MKSGLSQFLFLHNNNNNSNNNNNKKKNNNHDDEGQGHKFLAECDASRKQRFSPQQARVQRLATLVL